MATIYITIFDLESKIRIVEFTPDPTGSQTRVGVGGGRCSVMWLQSTSFKILNQNFGIEF